MSKENIKATFTLHDGSTLVANDTEEANNGTHAYNDLKAERQITIVTDSDTYIVPYHAVIKVLIEKTPAEVKPVEDANCNYKGC